jgi:hypothetical protein
MQHWRLLESGGPSDNCALAVIWRDVSIQLHRHSRVFNLLVWGLYGACMPNPIRLGAPYCVTVTVADAFALPPMPVQARV